VQIASGDSFSFPFESPAKGCVVHFSFQVHDGGEAAFEFKHAGQLLHEAHGEACEVTRPRIPMHMLSCLSPQRAPGPRRPRSSHHLAAHARLRRCVLPQGEVAVASGGMCEARWIANSWFYPISVSYEVVLTPADHFAAMRTRELLALATQGDVPAVLANLTATSIDAADEQGRTALHAAAAAGQTAVIQALLDEGAPIEAVSVQGRTPLLEACRSAHAPAVDLLIQRGASVAAADGDGRNCVHLLAAGAAGGGAEAGASGGAAGGQMGEGAGRGVEVGGAKGGDEAISNLAAGAAETLSLLLPSLTPALATARTRHGDSPLAALAAAGLTHCCQLFLDSEVVREHISVGSGPWSTYSGSGYSGSGYSGTDYSWTDELCRALTAAAAHGRGEAAALLLVRGAHPARSCGGDGTAVHAACSGGHAGVLAMLLEWLGNEVGDAPAHRAPEPGTSGGVSEGVAEAVRTTDGRWRAPLQCAAAAGSLECVRLLLPTRAPLEAHDGQGQTPLLAAAACGAASVARALLDAGAQPDARNSHGHDALACAARGGHSALLPLLLPLCPATIPEAIVGALAAGQGDLALELTKLCPLPFAPGSGPPAVSEQAARRLPETAPELSASARVVQLLWQRGVDDVRAGGRDASVVTSRDASVDVSKGDASVDVSKGDTSRDMSVDVSKGDTSRDMSVDASNRETNVRDASRDASGRAAMVTPAAAAAAAGGWSAESAAGMVAGMALGGGGGAVRPEAGGGVGLAAGAGGDRAAASTPNGAGPVAGAFQACADGAPGAAGAVGGDVAAAGAGGGGSLPDGAGSAFADLDGGALGDVEDIQDLIRRELEAEDSEEESDEDDDM
jgi:hypothetical protein